ncbi:MAG: hypothetical protein LBS91_07880 [Clostridiales Family XIII bacterium]|jgi:spore maturation protein SpmB|nr:hypothetical protein [Clostridiales Family XIII bacterium]
MAVFLKAILNGALKGLKTALMLLRIMVPIYLAVVVLKHTEVFPFLADRMAPVMAVFGLPGDAVVPMVAGVFSDEYAIVAAMGGFAFDKAALTTIAMICLCFHSIPVEAVITRQIGMPAWRMTLFRFGLAVLTGLLASVLGGLAL